MTMYVLFLERVVDRTQLDLFITACAPTIGRRTEDARDCHVS